MTVATDASTCLEKCLPSQKRSTRQTNGTINSLAICSHSGSNSGAVRTHSQMLNTSLSDAKESLGDVLHVHALQLRAVSS